MRKWRFLLLQATGRLWVRAGLYAGLGVATALLAALFAPFVPQALAKPFGGGTVAGLMNVLASSLLAVATFSAAAMLTAYANVSQGATPRAAALVSGNRQAHGALATFVGAFLYAVVGYSALGTGFYGPGGRVILFGVTLIVLAIVAVTLLRWLDQLLLLTGVGNAIAEVEAEAEKAMGGAFGVARPREEQPAPGSVAVLTTEAAFVRNVDVRALQALALKADIQIWIIALPGTFGIPGQRLAAVQGRITRDIDCAVRSAFTFGRDRSFEQDPQFGLTVLGEIAARALSPGVNNPGVATDVLAAATRLLARWMELERSTPERARDRVYWSDPRFEGALENALLPVAVDGASSLPIAVRLQSALAALAETATEAHRDEIVDFARDALSRSRLRIDHPSDRERVSRAAGWCAP